MHEKHPSLSPESAQVAFNNERINDKEAVLNRLILLQVKLFEILGVLDFDCRVSRFQKAAFSRIDLGLRLDQIRRSPSV